MKLKKGKFLGAIVLSLFLLASCKSLKNTNTLFQSEYDKFADTSKSVYVANSNGATNNLYKIKPFDIVSVRNIQSPTGPNPPMEGAIKATLFKVDQDGFISLPVIGQVNIAGLNQPEAIQKVQKLYIKNLLKDPLIELIVVNFKVTILGDAIRPGNYMMDKENIHLMEMIGESGGLKPSADAKRIKIIRGDLKNPEIIYVNLKNIQSLGSNKLRLQNNDIIYIPNKRLINVNENISTYITLLQPALLIINAIILFSIKTQ